MFACFLSVVVVSVVIHTYPDVLYPYFDLNAFMRLEGGRVIARVNRLLMLILTNALIVCDKNELSFLTSGAICSVGIHYFCSSILFPVALC